jgi:SAM-dependent methyltransferase
MIRRTYDHGYFQTALHRTSPDSQRNRKRLQVIRDYRPQGRLLEIGPGTGEFLHLASGCFDVEGIDISSHAVDRAHPELSSRIRVGNIEHTPLASNTYDVIAAFNILEHLREPATVIQRARRALVHQGCLVGSVPCNAGPVGRVYTQVTNFFDRTHCSTLAPDQWRALFLAAGFSLIHFFGEAPVGPRFSLHIHSRRWARISPNMMFVCQCV